MKIWPIILSNQCFDNWARLLQEMVLWPNIVTLCCVKKNNKHYLNMFIYIMQIINYFSSYSIFIISHMIALKKAIITLATSVEISFNSYTLFLKIEVYQVPNNKLPFMNINGVTQRAFFEFKGLNFQIPISNFQ